MNSGEIYSVLCHSVQLVHNWLNFDIKDVRVENAYPPDGVLDVFDQIILDRL